MSRVNGKNAGQITTMTIEARTNELREQETSVIFMSPPLNFFVQHIEQFRIPLIITMIVATVTVHLEQDWQAVYDRMSPFASAHVDGAAERLEGAKEILLQYGSYDWLTEYGGFVVSNNGIEWAATYFILLVALFFLGGGRYISLDYWIARETKTRYSVYSGVSDAPNLKTTLG